VSISRVCKKFRLSRVGSDTSLLGVVSVMAAVRYGVPSPRQMRGEGNVQFC
jgi:hypothetical protein